MPPIAPATDVMPSSSGTDAATSAPKAMNRITSVIGSEIISAFCRSFSTIWSIVASIVPGPATWTRAPGLAVPESATALFSPSTCLPASSGSPRRVTWTNVVFPPAVESDLTSWGPRTPATSGSLEARRVMSAVALAVIARSPERTSTLSTAGSRRSARSRSACAFAESPTPLWASVRDLVPTVVPAKTSPAMSTSQRTMTVFGRRAEAPAIAAVARPRTPTPGGVERGVEDMRSTLVPERRRVGPALPRPRAAGPRPRSGVIPRLTSWRRPRELSAHAQTTELASGR